MSKVLKMRRVSFGLILLLAAATFALPACTSAVTQAVSVMPTAPTQTVATTPTTTTTTEPVLEETALSEASVVPIDNNIDVMVLTSVSDQEILDAVNRVIRGLRAEITAQVENGVVTLSGFVSCCNEEELVGAVSNTNGVIQVINNFTWDDPGDENIC